MLLQVIAEVPHVVDVLGPGEECEIQRCFSQLKKMDFATKLMQISRGEV